MVCLTLNSVRQDHPRIRGDNILITKSHQPPAGSPPHTRGQPFKEGVNPNTLGSPPHTRGQRPVIQSQIPWTGITPAYAGTTDGV